MGKIQSRKKIVRTFPGGRIALLLLAVAAGFFSRAAWGQINSGGLPLVPAAFVNPPPSPILASSFFFATASVDPSAVKRAGFAVRNTSQTWEYPADFVVDLSLYKFYWDISSFAADSYVVTFWVETTDGRHGMVETFFAIAKDTSPAGSTTTTEPPPTAGSPTSSGATTTSGSGSTTGGTALPPELQITAPGDGALVDGSVRLEAVSSVALEFVAFALDNAVTTAAPDLTLNAVPRDDTRLRWEYALAANTLSAGTYTINAGGRAAGLTVKSVNGRTFTVVAATAAQLTPLQVSFRNPPPSPLDAPKYLFVQASVPFSEIRQVTLRVSSGATTRVLSGTAWPELELYQFYWNVNEFAAGSYVITTEVETNDGRRASGELYLAVQHAAPPSGTVQLPTAQIALIEPVAPNVRGLVALAAKTTPDASTVTFGYAGPRSGQLPARLDNGIWRATWDTQPLPAGDYQLWAFAGVNGAKVESIRQPVTVSAVESSPPSVSGVAIAFPLGNASLQGRVEFRGSVTPGAGRVRLWLQGAERSYEIGTPEISSDGRWVLAWDTATAADGMYAIVASAEFSDGATVTATPVLVSVANGQATKYPAAENQPPRVNAGADQHTRARTLALSGSVSDDGLPNPPGHVVVHWTHVGGPAAVEITEPRALTPAVRFSQPGTYRLRLEASDGQLKASDEVLVVVEEPERPKAVRPESPSPVPPSAPPPYLLAPTVPRPAVSPVIIEAIDPWCTTQGVTSVEACRQALEQARELLPEACKKIGILHPEACRRYIFNLSAEPSPNSLPTECLKENLTGEACRQRVRLHNLPDACRVAALHDPESCQRYLLSVRLPEECRQSGVATQAACDAQLRQQYVAAVCQQVGITEPVACGEYVQSRLAQTITCGDREADCAAAIARHLPQLAFQQQRLADLGAVVAPNVSAPLVLQPENQVRPAVPAAPASIEQFVPFVVFSPLPVRIIPSKPAVVIAADETVNVAAPAVVVFDTDGDGLPDDVEDRLGTDPQVADTDRDGYPDGQELATGHNPLGLGAPTMPVAPVDIAIAAGRILEQPQSLPAPLPILTVEKAESTAPPVAPDQPRAGLALSGRGIPGQVITLFIYSQLPLVLTTRVNEDGNWTYSLQQTLLDGPHEVYVTVNDETGKAIARSSPLQFFVRQARAASPAEIFRPTPPPSPGFSRARFYLPIAGLVVSLGAFLFLAVWSAHRKRGA